MIDQPPTVYRTYSVRLPEGLPEQLRQLTGVPFSTMIRQIAVLMLAKELNQNSENKLRQLPEKLKAVIDENLL
jgi:hypothetical protein